MVSVFRNEDENQAVYEHPGYGSLSKQLGVTNGLVFIWFLSVKK